MTAYYNEIDPYAAQWLRNLIAAGHIAQGEVDERSIEDIKPDDLMGYTQCHFFAGIGVWSHALRLAGWPDDRPVWTGSCPCQPFSSAGKGAGFADERHLWPAFFHLISQCRPPVVFGEQVASKDGLAWLDLVQADLEGAGYASGAADLCAAGIGAPHIRQRLYWVANAGCELQAERGSATGKRKQHLGAETRDFGCGGSGGLDNNNNTGLERHRADQTQSGWIGEAGSVATAGKSGGLADSARSRHREHERDCGTVGSPRSGDEGQKSQLGWLAQAVGDCGEDGRMADTDHTRQQLFACLEPSRVRREAASAGEQVQQLGADSASARSQHSGPTNGHWRDADWLYCRDGKWRPVEPGTFPLAYGATARVGRLRAYGNAIVPQVAQTFIEVYLDQQVEHGVLL